MLIQPNLDEVQQSVGEGVYKVAVTGAAVGEWPDKGKGVTPYVRWELSTFGEAEAKNEGRKIWHATPLAGKGAFLLANFYKAATGEILDSSAPSFDTEQLLGKQLEIGVAINEKGYTDIKSVKAL